MSFLESLEPRVLLAATQAYDWQNAVMKGNGFINGIVYSPTVSGLAYIHTDMGGAYRYDAGVSKWTPLNDFSRWNDWPAQNMGVETLAVDPTDGNKVYMALGTYMSPTAILRSSDQGHTWSRTDVSFNSNGNGSARNTGERMVVDPNSPNILYYGTRDDGLWKSTNYGASWSVVSSFPTIGLDSGWGQDTGLLFVKFDATSASAGTATRTIYVGLFDPTAGVPRIYRSTDAGGSWSALAGGQPTTANLFPQRAALSPDGSAMYITYASSTSYPGPYGVSNGQVFKVTNPGSSNPTWTNITPPVSYSFSAVTLDPVNPNTVYVGEMGDYNPADRIWRSTNGGSSWSVISPNGNRDDTSAKYAESLNIHWLGDLQIDPHNRDIALLTTGYGLYRTTNLTSSNPRWSFFNEGFDQSAVLEIASPNDGPVNLFDAIGDRDGFRHVDFNVSPVAGLLGQNNGMNRGTSDDIEVAFSNANHAVRLTRSSPYVQYSIDNGVTWQWMSNTNNSGSTAGGGNLALSADGSRVLYEPGGTGRLRYATRSGNTWSSWTTLSGTYPANNAKVVADTVDSDTFFAFSGTTSYRSTNGGVTWSAFTNVLPASVNWMRAVPGQSGHLVVSTGSSGNGVWRSSDGGATWNRLAPASATHAIAVGVGAGPTATSYPSIFIAGTVDGQTGFFRSDDQGASWISISDANHQYGYVTVIQGDPRVHGRLYVGSNGRGLLVGGIADTVAPTVIASDFHYDRSPNLLSFRFSESVLASLGSDDLIVLPAGGGASIAATLLDYDASTNTARFTLPGNLANGDYTARIVATGVSDAAGNVMIADVVLPFFSLAGDINRDRAVDFSDLLILAKNYNRSPATYREGDLTHDNVVNFDDLLVLAKNYNARLPQIPPTLMARPSLFNTGGGRIGEAVLGGRESDKLDSD